MKFPSTEVENLASVYACKINTVLFYIVYSVLEPLVLILSERVIMDKCLPSKPYILFYFLCCGSYSVRKLCM